MPAAAQIVGRKSVLSMRSSFTLSRADVAGPVDDERDVHAAGVGVAFAAGVG